MPYAKNFVKDAPRVDSDGPLGHDDERRLYDYYATAEGTGDPDPTEGSDTAGHGPEQTPDTTERLDAPAGDAERDPVPPDGDGGRPHGRHVRTSPPS